MLRGKYTLSASSSSSASSTAVAAPSVAFVVIVIVRAVLSATFVVVALLFPAIAAATSATTTTVLPARALLSSAVDVFASSGRARCGGCCGSGAGGGGQWRRWIRGGEGAFVSSPSTSTCRSLPSNDAPVAPHASDVAAAKGNHGRWSHSIISIKRNPHPTRRRRRSQHCSSRRPWGGVVLFAKGSEDGADDDDDDYFDDDDDDAPPPMMNDGFYDDDFFNDGDDRGYYTSMTVEKLKQQLRLRRLKVSGNKAELVDRLLRGEQGSVADSSGSASATAVAEKSTDQKTTKASAAEAEASYAEKVVADARAKGADVVDVSEYVEKKGGDDGESEDGDQEDSENHDDGDDEPASSSSSSSPEVWGLEARIVEDYEGRSAIVDGLSRTRVGYSGDGGAEVQAYVSASRDALRKFMSGGNKGRGQEAKSDTTGGKGESGEGNDPASASATPSSSSSLPLSDAEQRVYEAQRKRESESARTLLGMDDTLRNSEDTGVANDGSDSDGLYDNVIPRDYGDWGLYSTTGAYVSKDEVRAVLLLSDVSGPFSDEVKALADKIAFECQPVVVFAPDVFRGRPWGPVSKEERGKGTDDNDDNEPRNKEGKTYEEWRATHPDRRVSVDVRAAAAVLRRRYAASGIAVWGLGYGGGRALEAAAAAYPYEGGGIASYRTEAEAEEGATASAPPHVDPVACVAWYPTRYDVAKLFGKKSEGFPTFADETDRSVAVMAIFGGDDDLPGAAPDDASELKRCLEDDPRVKDCMVKVFPRRGHGFAHQGLGDEDGSRQEQRREDKEENRFVEEEFGGPIRSDYGIGGDAEVACLLSTAFTETYARTFLPTVGTPVKDDENERWTVGLEMESTDRYDDDDDDVDDNDSGSEKKKQKIDVRKEIEEAIANHQDMEVDLRRMPRSRSPLSEEEDGDGAQALDEIEDEREEIVKNIKERYNISDDDDKQTLEEKLARAYEDGAFKELLVDGYWDESSDAFW